MRRVLIIIAVLILTVAALAVAGFLLLGFYLSPQSSLVKADAIVAISGGETESRTKEAVRLYSDDWAPLLIFSGAASDPNSPSNAAVMRQQAIKEGVPAGDILVEEKSANTAQNAEEVAEMVRRRGIKKIILVTSPYHQRRASISFRSALGRDVEILNHSTIDHRWRRSRWWGNRYSYEVTVAEFQKVMFLILTGRTADN